MRCAPYQAQQLRGLHRLSSSPPPNPAPACSLHQGHDAPIRCLALHPNKRLVATGQVGARGSSRSRLALTVGGGTPRATAVCVRWRPPSSRTAFTAIQSPGVAFVQPRLPPALNPYALPAQGVPAAAAEDAAPAASLNTGASAPAGSAPVSGAQDGACTICVWDSATSPPALVARIEAPRGCGRGVVALAFSPGRGDRLAAVLGDEASTVRGREGWGGAGSRMGGMSGAEAAWEAGSAGLRVGPGCVGLVSIGTTNSSC
jgi:hypothetical protein